MGNRFNEFCTIILFLILAFPLSYFIPITEKSLQNFSQNTSQILAEIFAVIFVLPLVIIPLTAKPLHTEIKNIFKSSYIFYFFFYIIAILFEASIFSNGSKILIKFCVVISCLR